MLYTKENTVTSSAQSVNRSVSVNQHLQSILMKESINSEPLFKHFISEKKKELYQSYWFKFFNRAANKKKKRPRVYIYS